MRTDTESRATARGKGSRLRALVAAAVATLGVTAGLLAVASPAGASIAGDTLVFNPAIASFGAGAPGATIVVDVNKSGVLDPAASGDTITLSTNPSASLTNQTATVNGSGVATFSGFQIAAAGTYTISAADTTSAGVNGASQVGVDVYGSATHIVFTTEPPASSAGTFSATVSVEDANNNVVANSADSISLSLAVAGSGCSGLSGGGAQDATNGIDTFPALTLTAGTGCELSADDITSTLTATSTAVTHTGAPTHLAFSTLPPTLATYGTAMSTFAVGVYDASNNIEAGGGANSGVGDTVTLVANGCSFTTSETAVVAATGIATFSGVTFSGSVATNCSITANVTNTPPITSVTSSSISVSSTAPAKLGFSTQPPVSAVAGIAFTAFTVVTEEGNGTPLTTGSDTTDTITLTSSCKLSGVVTAVEAAGVATFSDVIVTSAGTCTLIAADTSNGAITSSTGNATTVTAGTPTHVAYTTAPPTTFGSLTSPLTAFKVSVEDVYGNVTTTTTGSSDTITITSTNCTLTGTTSVVSVAGVAIFSAVTITTPGSCVLTASDVTRTMTTAQATVTVGQPQATLVVSSTKGYLGTPLALKTSGGSGTGAVTFTVASGTAQGCAIVNGALKTTGKGTCIVTASKAASGTYALATSAVTTVTIGAPLPKAQRVVGAILWGHQITVTIIGNGFFGRPRVISNAAGFTARVIRNNGKQLTLVIFVSTHNKAGVHVLVIIEPNGQRTSVRYVLRA